MCGWYESRIYIELTDNEEDQDSLVIRGKEGERGREAICFLTNGVTLGDHNKREAWKGRTSPFILRCLNHMSFKVARPNWCIYLLPNTLVVLWIFQKTNFTMKCEL